MMIISMGREMIVAMIFMIIIMIKQILELFILILVSFKNFCKKGFRNSRILNSGDNGAVGLPDTWTPTGAWRHCPASAHP